MDTGADYQGEARRFICVEDMKANFIFNLVDSKKMSLDIAEFLPKLKIPILVQTSRRCRFLIIN